MSVIKAFNDHFIEFLDDILQIFPQNHDIRTVKTSIEALRKVNPRKIVTIWHNYVMPYRAYIDAGDISFFIDKDYKQDLQDTGHTGTIIQSINQMRDPVRQMGEANQAKAMKYIQNLTQLAQMA